MVHIKKKKKKERKKEICFEHSIFPTGGKYFFTAVTHYIFKTAVVRCSIPELQDDAQENSSAERVVSA